MSKKIEIGLHAHPIFGLFSYLCISDWPLTEDRSPAGSAYGHSNRIATSPKHSPLPGGYDFTETVDVKHKGGFYYDLGLGLNYKMINFGFGLMHQAMTLKSASTSSGQGGSEPESYELKEKNNSFYVKVGVKF